MIQAPHQDDAFAFVVEKLRGNPNGYGNGNNAMYDVWLLVSYGNISRPLDIRRIAKESSNKILN
jgi:hypothetical protein